uniref:Uncharacterized protein n=1 Tax=Cacopsylla melanoneura TaxID=428564 RepID=A0A8D9AUM8_9HEMI
MNRFSNSPSTSQGYRYLHTVEYNYTLGDENANFVFFDKVESHDTLVDYVRQQVGMDHRHASQLCVQLHLSIYWYFFTCSCPQHVLVRIGRDHIWKQISF